MKPARFWASAFYFAYFGAAGALTPYLNVYYQRTGLNLGWIGLLAALPTLLGLISNPLWGALADGFHLHKRLLPLLMFLTVPFGFLIYEMKSLPLLIGMVALYAICLAPIIPLGDYAVLSMLGDQRYEYGKLRLWGAVGWSFAALGTGVLIETSGIWAPFAIFAILMTLGAWVANHLPAPVQTDASLSGAAAPSIWNNLGRLLHDPRWIGLLVGLLLAGMALNVYQNYFILRVKELGGGEGLFGLSMIFSGASELPIFFFSAAIMRRWSPKGLLMFSFAIIAARDLLVSWMGVPWLALGLQLLHGPAFSAMWAAGVNYASEIAPKGLGASVQTLFTAVTFGLGGTLGALLGSRVGTWLGLAGMFRLAGIIGFTGLAALFFSGFTGEANFFRKKRS